jgi:clan AA aspartic protease
MTVKLVEPRLQRPYPDLIQAGECMGEMRVDVKLVNASDEAVARRGLMDIGEVRRCEVIGLIDTGAVRVCIPVQIADQLGLELSGRTGATYADGRKETVDVTEPIRIEIAGRSTVQYALVLGDEVLIGRLVLEDTDLWADCTRRRLVPNPAHPDQPVFPVK